MSHCMQPMVWFSYSGQCQEMNSNTTRKKGLLDGGTTFEVWTNQCKQPNYFQDLFLTAPPPPLRHSVVHATSSQAPCILSISQRHPVGDVPLPPPRLPVERSPAVAAPRCLSGFDDLIRKSSVYACSKPLLCPALLLPPPHDARPLCTAAVPPGKCCQVEAGARFTGAPRALSPTTRQAGASVLAHACFVRWPFCLRSCIVQPRAHLEGSRRALLSVLSRGSTGDAGSSSAQPSSNSGGGCLAGSDDQPPGSSSSVISIDGS